MDFQSRRRRKFPKFRRPNLDSFEFSLDMVTAAKLVRYCFFGLIGLLVLTIILFVWFSRDLPTPGKLVESQNKNSTRIYDRNGKLLYSVYEDVNRTYVKLDDIPEDLRNATIAIEDENFYKNSGFDPLAPFRIAYNVVFKGRVIGGSTITQQLVKNVLLTPDRTPIRKLQELILSIQVNQRFSKDEILEMYLNNIPYGGTALGVESAAETYFGKKAKDLTLAESVFLAGLPQSPSYYSPFNGEKNYLGRTRDVLNQMVDNKYITKQKADSVYKEIEGFKFTQRDIAGIKAPHFVMYIKELLADQFGDAVVETGGLQVTTSLDYDLQEDAEKIVKDEIEKLEKYKVGNGAALITEAKSGEILAMVGSKDYFDVEAEGTFNVVIDGERQPGSSLKPVIYAQAFEEGYTPATMLMDVKTEFPTGDPNKPYIPGNYDGKFRGPSQIRFALGNSLNIPAVKMLAMVGIKDAMQKGYDMGIRNWEPTTANMRNVGLSLVLGGRETTLYDEVTAYGVFANGGVRQDLVSILKVTDSKGKKLFEHKKKEGKRVLSEGTSFLISHILLDNNARVDAFGPNSFLRIPGKTVAVKTGTTDEKKDNWAIGYTPSYVVGVWVGNNNSTAMNPAIASGTTGASPIWHYLMRRVLKDKPNEEFKKPGNVESVIVDSFVGGLPYGSQPTRSEFFIKGTEPTAASPVYKSKDGKNYYVFRENDPVSTDGKNRWQEGINAWIQQFHKNEEAYNPPGDIDKKPEEKKEEPTPTPKPADPTPTPAPTTAPTTAPTATPTPVALLSPTP